MSPDLVSFRSFFKVLRMPSASMTQTYGHPPADRLEGVRDGKDSNAGERRQEREEKKGNMMMMMCSCLPPQSYPAGMRVSLGTGQIRGPKARFLLTTESVSMFNHWPGHLFRRCRGAVVSLNSFYQDSQTRKNHSFSILHWQCYMMSDVLACLMSPADRLLCISRPSILLT